MGTAMRRFFTAVLEQGNTVTGDVATEPYEVGWAGEARWFIRALSIDGDTEVVATPELSPDGLVWCEAGAAPLRLSAATPALVTAEQRGFGNWLRLNLRVTGRDPRAKLVVYLALKE